MANISEDNVTITMTYDQHDAIIVQSLKLIHKDAQNQITKLESKSNLKDYQKQDLIYDQDLLAACEVLLRYHLTEHDYKKEMENE